MSRRHHSEMGGRRMAQVHARGLALGTLDKPRDVSKRWRRVCPQGTTIGPISDWHRAQARAGDHPPLPATLRTGSSALPESRTGYYRSGVTVHLTRTLG
jgi:hypothetical protein